MKGANLRAAHVHYTDDRLGSESHVTLESGVRDAVTGEPRSHILQPPDATFAGHLTRQEAIDAVRALCDAAGCQMPTVTKHGAGAHEWDFYYA